MTALRAVELVVTDEATRAAMGIEFCARCGCDTMPSEITGRCFFCDTQLVDAPDAPIGARRCEECDAAIVDGRVDKRFCKTRCRQLAAAKRRQAES